MSRKRKPRPLLSKTLDVVVDVLGAHGDGVATHGGQTYFIPGVLPGERVRIKTGRKRGSGMIAHVLDILQASAERIEAPCPHFDRCGGCQLQHMHPGAYAAWKRERVVTALAQRGFAEVTVLEPVLIGPGTRRRATFTAQKRGPKVRFGFNAQSSHDVEEVAACLLLVAGLNDVIAPLKTVMETVLQDGGRARIATTWCENGVDILIEGETTPDLATREALATLVTRDLAVRVAWKNKAEDPEPIAQAQAPVVNIAGVLVGLPMGGFLQASVQGEAAINAQVAAGVGDAGRIADLYCGLGSLTLPLARTAIVRAVDRGEASVRALSYAAGRADWGGRVMAHVRDLDRQPLEVKELSKFDAIVFDPPREGAAAQVAHIAQSHVARVVAVSCNPATFARDARILVDGGYRLLDVLPIDPFTFSPHVEVVARFER